jgi:hypothetical protein
LDIQTPNTDTNQDLTAAKQHAHIKGMYACKHAFHQKMDEDEVLSAINHMNMSLGLTLQNYP